MASFNDPKLSNHIADDVPAIRQLLRSVAALDPATGNTDIPNGAKRLVETAQGYEFQSYNGTSWTMLEKWNLDVQKVDGYSASTGTTASTIPVRDSSGKLPGDILGNAATASKAAALSATNPIATGGTGATTAEQARANLVVPPKNHASSSSEFGAGSSTQYGHTKTHDAPDSTKSAATGHAFSPAGAAAMQETLEGQISDLTSVVNGNAAAQSTKDAAQDAAIATKLDKGGDTMSGALVIGYGAQIQAFDDDNSLNLYGGAGYRHGGQLTLIGRGASYLPGGFRLGARDADATCWFDGSVDGRLTWMGDEVLVYGKSGAILPGMVVAFAANSTPDGFLLCNGAIVSRTTYAKLFAAIGTTYGAGNGSSTFALPNLTDKFIQGSGTAGTSKAAGLPELSGGIAFSVAATANAPLVANANGVFTSVASIQRTMTGASGTSTTAKNDLTFSASQSSSIYGASTTVQPPALTMRYYIKY